MRVVLAQLTDPKARQAVAVDLLNYRLFCFPNLRCDLAKPSPQRLFNTAGQEERKNQQPHLRPNHDHDATGCRWSPQGDQKRKASVLMQKVIGIGGDPNLNE